MSLVKKRKEIKPCQKYEINLLLKDALIKNKTNVKTF